MTPFTWTVIGPETRMKTFYVWIVLTSETGINLLVVALLNANYRVAVLNLNGGLALPGEVSQMVAMSLEHKNLPVVAGSTPVQVVGNKLRELTTTLNLSMHGYVVHEYGSTDAFSWNGSNIKIPKKVETPPEVKPAVERLLDDAKVGT